MSLLIRFVFIFLMCMPFVAAAQAAENEIVLSWWSAVYPPDEQLRGDFLERAKTLTDMIRLPDDASFHEKADGVRQFLSKNSIHQIDDEFYRYWHSMPALMAMIGQHAENPQSYKPHMECASRSMTMFWMLRALGIRTRAVVIYRADDINRSHTFLEVYNPETQKWEIQDPDQNAYWIFTESGERAGVEDLLTYPVDETFLPCQSPDECGYWDRVRIIVPYFNLASIIDMEAGQHPILVNTDRFPDNARAFYRAGLETSYCALFAGDCYEEIIELRNKK